jgi:hypothetical protein
VAGDYFTSLGYTLQAGRFLGITDDEKAPAAAVITETAARRFFNGGNALGRRIALGDASPPRWVEIVGIVGDVRNHGLPSHRLPRCSCRFAAARRVEQSALPDDAHEVRPADDAAGR